MAKKDRADQIGDEIVEAAGGDLDTSPDDDPTVGTPPLEAKEEAVVDDAKPAEGAEKDDEKPPEGDAPLLGGSFPASAEGIAQMEEVLKGHQAGRDRAEATLLKAGFVKGEDGVFVKPADAPSIMPEGLSGFDADLLAVELLGEPEEKEVEVPEDYDPTNPLHVVKMMRGVVRDEREADRGTATIANQIRELRQYYPAITRDEVKALVDWAREGNLSLTSLYAIKTGKAPATGASDTSEVKPSESTEDKAADEAARATALRDFEKAQAARGAAPPGTETPGAGAGGTGKKSPEDKIGDEIVEQSEKERRRI